MRYGGGLSSSNIKVGPSGRKGLRVVVLSGKLRTGPRLPALMTPKGRISTAIPKIPEIPRIPDIPKVPNIGHLI